MNLCQCIVLRRLTGSHRGWHCGGDRDIHWPCGLPTLLHGLHLRHCTKDNHLSASDLRHHVLSVAIALCTAVGAALTTVGAACAPGTCKASKEALATTAMAAAGVGTGASTVTASHVCSHAATATALAPATAPAPAAATSACRGACTLEVAQVAPRDEAVLEEDRRLDAKAPHHGKELLRCHV